MVPQAFHNYYIACRGKEILFIIAEKVKPIGVNFEFIHVGREI